MSAPPIPTDDGSTANLDLLRDGRAYCPADCAQACLAASWAHLLDRTADHAPPAWRLAWALHGMPHPMPADERPDALAAFARTFGTATLVKGLRLAATIRPAHGSGVSARELDLLADRLEKAAAGKGVAA